MHRREEEEEHPKPVKEEPNWAISALYSDRQLVVGKFMTKYFIPFDSATPKAPWNLHISEASSDAITTFKLDQPSTLIGRTKACNLRLLLPKISRQHCIIQFRKVRLSEEDPMLEVVPYIFDMNSKSGTYVNDELIKPSSFVQLFERDVIKFSNRENPEVFMQINLPTSTAEPPEE